MLLLYNNVENIIDGSTTPSLNLSTEYNLITSNMLGTNNCIHSKPTIFDINNDGLPDLIRGNASGGVELFLAENFNINNAINRLDEIKIYPNPNNGSFNIQTPDYSKYHMMIYSNLGQLILTTEITSQDKFIELNLKTGIYIIRIENQEKLFTEKIIVN